MSFQAAAANDLRAFNRLLDENPICLNAQDDKGWTPLHHACKNNAVDVVTNLLQRKAGKCGVFGYVEYSNNVC